MKTQVLSWMALLLLVIGMITMPGTAKGDAVPGEEIITLGEDLGPDDRTRLLEEMSADENDTIIYVSNEEEHRYLGDYISASQIGTRALSSTKITLTEEGSGLNVETNNINWVSEGMYANALVTAGVKDADIYVTAPFQVSGTAALTGLIKAYEVQADVVIPEEQKKVANEEMVRTAELGERIGTEEATELITRIKEEIGRQSVESEEDLRALIINISNELNITLNEEEVNGLVSLFDRMQDLNIDWNQVQDQISKVRNNLDDFLNREDTQSFIASFLDFINQLIDSARGWLSSES
ncbi:DUF1002 domain-containing protein [Thalassobacillus sp. C254]|uniref:DUF1002 domain-containing protein n=1 Tax=Thalassobacillus sp. C254 TaxID=1225341 RepID=UPI0006D2C9AF|nr:DUF1002 domain-containing protein [Thalassobacillus sp. C254]